MRPHSRLSVAGPSYEAVFWAELGWGWENTGRNKPFPPQQPLWAAGSWAVCTGSRHQAEVGSLWERNVQSWGRRLWVSGSRPLTHSPACVVALTFLDGAWACGQSSALAAPWVGKAALAIILQPTCYLCLGMEVSHIQVRSLRLRDLGRLRALSKSSQTIASLPSTGPLAVTTAS